MGGNTALKSQYGCTIVGFSKDAKRIPGMDIGVVEGDAVKVGNLEFKVFEVPGASFPAFQLWFRARADLVISE